VSAPELGIVEALRRAEHKLSAYVGVCKGDKELTDTVLPMARLALKLWDEAQALRAQPAPAETCTHWCHGCGEQPPVVTCYNCEDVPVPYCEVCATLCNHPHAPTQAPEKQR
jgi:hypothetical protein